MPVAFESSKLMLRTFDSNTTLAINSLAKRWAFSQGHIWSRKAIIDLARPNSILQGLIWSRKESVFDLARPNLISKGGRIWSRKALIGLAIDHHWSRKAIFDLARPYSISQGLIWSRKSIFDLERPYSILQCHRRSVYFSRLKDGECNDKQWCTLGHGRALMYALKILYVVVVALAVLHAHSALLGRDWSVNRWSHTICHWLVLFLSWICENLGKGSNANAF